MRTIIALLLALLLSVSASAQTHVDVGTDYGRVYSVAAGTWVMSTAPSVELSRGRSSLNWTFYLDKGKLFEHDLIGSYYHELTSRIILTGTVSRFQYVNLGVPTDWSWQVSARWRLR